MIFILDVSKWQEPSQVPWAVLWDLGFRLVIIKSSMGGGKDPYCLEHAQLAKDHGFLVALYHWVDPIQNWTTQATEYFFPQIDAVEPIAVGYDCEQYWASWSKWQDYVAGKIPNSQVPRTTEYNVVNSYLTVRNLALAQYGSSIPEKRHMIYSADWFTDIFPGLAEASKEHELWIADWSYSRTIVHTQFDGNFKLDIIDWYQWQQLIWDEMKDGAYDGVPLLLGDRKDFRMWQADSKVVPPGSPSRYDISFFNGDEAAFNLWLDKTEPEPDPTEIEKLWAAVNQIQSNMVSKQDLINAEIVNPVVLKWLEDDLDEPV